MLALHAIPSQFHECESATETDIFLKVAGQFGTADFVCCAGMNTGYPENCKSDKHQPDSELFDGTPP
jgi:hypothetical protein